MQVPGLALLAGAGLALALVLVLAAAPALALDDISGSYAGKMSCKGYSGGTAAKTKLDITIDVAEGKGVALQVKAGGAQIGETIISPILLEDAAKLDRGKLAGVDCATSFASSVGVALQADAGVKPGSEKGTLKGTLTRRSGVGAGAIDECTFSVKRTSTTVPVFELCPAITLQ
jgi:hypothetical protein